MQGSKAKLSVLAEKCKTVIVSNWQGYLNTTKPEYKAWSFPDFSGLHTSKVTYVMSLGSPYLWVPKSEPHNENIMFDERGSFSVAQPVSHGDLSEITGEVPFRVDLTGEIILLQKNRIKEFNKYVEDVIQSEREMMSDFPDYVRGILDLSKMCADRFKGLKALVDGGNEKYLIYKFVPSSCMLINAVDVSEEIDLKVLKLSKPDPLGEWSTRLVDGINKNGSRRRAFIRFCLYYLDLKARDAFIASMDNKGFNLLGKILIDQPFGDECYWQEFRFEFEEEVKDIKAFCHQLMEMERGGNKLTIYTGLRY